MIQQTNRRRWCRMSSVESKKIQILYFSLFVLSRFDKLNRDAEEEGACHGNTQVKLFVPQHFFH